MVFNYIVPCLFGLEGLCADELKMMGASNVCAYDGRVAFSGDEELLAKANINLRTGERVLILLGSFKAESFDDLFEGVKALPLENYITKDSAFPVKGHSIRSKLFSIPDCQKIIKKAAVERLKSKYHLAYFPETGNKVQLQFSIINDVASIMIDTSGIALHKRGYRPQGNAAPLRETLAAAMVKLAHYKAAIPLWDPFCGSGTIAIEAAMYSANMAPGLHRRFDGERLPFINSSAWQHARADALDAISLRECDITATDIDPQAIELTRLNAQRAGVAKLIKTDVLPVKAMHSDTPRGMIICNPPYGERLSDSAHCAELYKEMGTVFARLDNWKYFVITSHEQFELYFGKRADKKRKLYNGMIKCDLYQYFK
ncbi:MAG: class I SAM-dependent RNA methyltransferase [Ruminococcaceae bacterium]|nr:class I SAM-dependent RNA methyltransferase [Oscillospiraceae bacterium]